ncbi:hypothetical protein Trydic_g9667 [Trypoxylus dichotomus]
MHHYVHLNYNEFTNLQGIVNAFADNFFSIAIVYCYHTSDTLSNLPTFSFHCVTLDAGVYIRKLKNKSTAGNNSTPSLRVMVTRNCACVFAEPLALIPNAYPRYCKNFLFSIRMIRQMLRITNHLRSYPNSLRFLIDTLPEHPTEDKVMYISSLQHDFVPGRCIVAILACIPQDISAELDRENQMDVTIADLSKAFDSIDHGILLQKLR